MVGPPSRVVTDVSEVRRSGFDARPAVYAGRFQRITNAVGA
jgi:hypothetical protein